MKHFEPKSPIARIRGFKKINFSVNREFPQEDEDSITVNSPAFMVHQMMLKQRRKKYAQGY